MTLQEKYHHAIQTAKNLGMDGSTHERDGKLHLVGTVTSEVEKDAIWEAIRTVPDWQTEVAADVRVRPVPDVEAPVSSMKTHTVEPGETLSSIAEKYMGRPADSVMILDANRDQLSDADAVKPGQVLKIPAMKSQLR